MLDDTTIMMKSDIGQHDEKQQTMWDALCASFASRVPASGTPSHAVRRLSGMCAGWGTARSAGGARAEEGVRATTSTSLWSS